MSPAHLPLAPPLLLRCAGAPLSVRQQQQHRGRRSPRVGPRHHTGATWAALGCCASKLEVTQHSPKSCRRAAVFPLPIAAVLAMPCLLSVAQQVFWGHRLAQNIPLRGDVLCPCETLWGLEFACIWGRGLETTGLMGATTLGEAQVRQEAGRVLPAMASVVAVTQVTDCQKESV